MRNNLFFAYTAVLAFIVLSLAACKEDTIIKSKLAPGSNDIFIETVADTFTVITKSILLERLNTSEKIDNFPVVQALGTITDEFYGRTNAGLYFQVLPNVTDFAFSAGGYTIDSAVLILPYAGFGFGNRTDPKPQNFKVYRLDESMSIEESYFSDQDLNTGALLGEATIDLQSTITDTPQVLGENTGFKHIRIRLNDDYINDVRSQIGTGTFSTDENFLNYFKGFYVAPDSTVNYAAGADLLPYLIFDGGSDYSRVAVAFYFREDGNNETKVAFFNYNRDKTANFNRISRNYTGYLAESFVGRYQNTKEISDDTLLMQNEPGMAIDVRIPFIGTLPQASILKAELVFTKILSGTASDSLQEHNRLTVVGIDDNGDEYEINDFAGDVTAATLFIDGEKREEKDNNGTTVVRYKINIPREVQKAINDGRNEVHLRIKGARSFPAAYRLLLGGRNHSTNHTQLNVVYTKPN